MMTLVQFVLGLLAISIALSLVMSVAWIVEQRSGNSGWIDTIWTFGLGLVGAASALVMLPSEQVVSARQWLVATFAVVWSFRLGLHIARRSSTRRDDPRYARLRENWGPSAPWQMWVLVQKQAIVSIPMGLAIWLAAHNPTPGLRLQDYVAAMVLLIAVAGEAIADRQLKQFQREHPAGAICDVGLWRWSRHPNYFFEWFGWLAYPLIAIDAAGNYPYGWLALAGPACMYWLLVYVSGIPPLESHMVRTRGDAFRAYRERTSAFIPWPPSSISSGGRT
jgi:steroid 5-alpha reductase family enzyme